MVKKVILALLALAIFDSVNGQINLLPGTSTVNNNPALPYTVSKIPIRLNIAGTVPVVATTVNFILVPNTLPANSSLLTSSVTVTPTRWNQIITTGTGILDTTLDISIPSVIPYVSALNGSINIVGQSSVHMILFTPALQEPSFNVSLEKGFITNLHPLLDKNSLPQTDTVHVHLLLSTNTPNASPISDVVVKFDFIPFNLKNHFQIQNSSLAITPARWNAIVTRENNKLDTFLYVFSSALSDTADYDDIGHIIIHSKPEFHTVRFTTKGMFKSQPFWIELGSNFDLLEKIKPNNLYGGVYMFAKDITKIGKKTKISSKFSNISFAAGVYESQSVSLSASSDSGFIYRDGTSYLAQRDTSRTPRYPYYRYYRDIGSIATTTEVKSIGLFFSPYLRMNKIPTEENGFHWFISVYAEMLWQRVKSTFDYSKTTRDTSYLVGTLDSVYLHNYKENSASADYRSHYFGLGIPIYIKQNTYNLYLNTVLGVSNQRFTPVQNNHDLDTTIYTLQKVKSIRVENNLTNTYAIPKHPWKPFYVVQFRLTEDKFGISFTGEVRGMILKESKPIISLALSKKFNVAELFNTIVKPFSSSVN